MTKEQINKALDALFSFLKGEVSIGSIEATRKSLSKTIKVEIHFINKKGEYDSLELRTEDYKSFEVWSYKTDKEARLGFSEVKIATIRL